MKKIRQFLNLTLLIGFILVGMTGCLEEIIGNIGSDDARLQEIELDGATLEPSFDKDLTVYQAEMDSAVDPSCEITVDKQTDKQSVTIDGNTQDNATVVLTGDTKTVEIICTAADGTTTKTYTVEFRKKGNVESNEARLANIEIDKADIDFDQNTLAYNAELNSESDTSCTISVEKLEAAQSVIIDGTSATEKLVAIPEAGKTVVIEVTAEDGITKKEYSLSISRKASPEKNVYLSSLSVKNGSTSIAITPSFSKLTETYTATVPAEVDYVTVSGVTEDSGASLKINNQAGTSKNITLQVGANSILFAVTSADNSSVKVYTLNITRSGQTISSLLSNLTLSSGTLTPSFSQNGFSYGVTINSSSISLTPTAVDSAAVITVNGQTVSSGTASSAIIVNAGETKKVTVNVQGSDDSNNYEVNVTRQNQEEGDAYLSGLTTSAGSLSFNKNIFGYQTFEVEKSVSSITVTPTAEDATASISVNGSAATSGSAKTVSLTEGEDNLIDITVTDGANTKTYLFAVTRKGEGGAAITGTWVNVKVPSSWGWDGPYIYYWTDSNSSYVTWDNSPTMDSEGNDWYSYHVDLDSVNAICKGKASGDAGQDQTGDQMGLSGEVYLTAGDSGWTKSTTAPDSNAPVHGGNVWQAPARPTITFNPDGGEVSSGSTVSITSNGNGGGSIVESGYLVNGKKYSGSSFNFSANCEVLAYAVNSDGGVTISSVKSFTLPDGKPKITINPTSGSFTDSISVDINVTLENSKEYKIDSGSWQTLSSSSLTLGSAIAAGQSVTLQVRATNANGTTTSQICTYSKIEVVENTFSWDNATVYFVMNDRFSNGNSSNDHSYGRRNDYGGGTLSVGTFHGGDIAGLTNKLDYLDDLGVNAIWITATYEQMHGFCGGARDGNFPHYGYHGYYTMDYTMMDKNMGTVDEMRTFVTEAHKKGIRIIMDIVLNHPGYNTALDAMQYNFGGNPQGKSEQDAINWTPGGGQNWHSYHDIFFNYNSNSAWSTWWSSSWIRSGLPGHEFVTKDANENALKCNLEDLPDFLTERTGGVSAAPILKTKWAKESSGYDNWIVPAARNLRQDLNVAPADYVIKWLAAWVEEFGIDGFRCDTAKHVDLYRWQQLKNACSSALSNWRSSSRSDNDPAKEWSDGFWMTGEHWDFNNGGGGHSQGDYYSNGFDNMIDFGYKGGVPSMGGLDGKFNNYANSKLLPYISSHDTGNVYWNGDSGRQKWAGTALLLNPSPVQIYYGDEIGRDNGDNGGDPNQGSRSDFQWNKVDNDINQHWKKIGKFRQQHVAIGAGQHSKISDSPYTFSRVKDSDKVVVCLGASGSTQVSVSGIFSDGTQVRNAYDGSTTTVSGGKATFSGDVILIEAAQ